jgi:type I restriction enzyme S subunit
MSFFYTFILHLYNLRNLNQLKKSVLQEAIQGKLVPQIASEGTAESLLEEIRAEKDILIKEKKIKRDKLDSIIFKGDDNKYYEKVGRDVIDITEEIPFEIPSTWCWCRVHTIFQLNPKNDTEDSAESAFVPMEKIAPGYGSSFIYDTVSWQQIKRGYTHFADGDIGFAKITPCFQNRKSVIFTGLPNGIGAGTTELKILRVYDNTINRQFALSFLKSPYFIEQATFKGTANQQRIVSGYLENKLFPLPPINEQKRIVAQIEKLFEQLR